MGSSSKGGRIGVLLLAFCCWSGALRAEEWPQPYRFEVRPLGGMSGLGNYEAKGLNNLGHVVGNAVDAAGNLHTFLYDGARMTDIAALTALNASVAGINSAGQIVGTAGGRGFVYDGGAVTYFSGALPSAGLAINDAGQATGWALLEAGGPRQAIVFANGVVTDANSHDSDTHSEGRAINAHGDIAGVFVKPGPWVHRPAVFYADGSLAEPSLGASWEGIGYALDINDAGAAVGWHHPDTYPELAFLYADGITHPLYPRLRWPSHAYGINNRGQVIGDLGIWEANGILYSVGELLLPGQEMDLREWNLLNDAGQLVAQSCAVGGCELVLLTPVPEPAGAMMLVAGLAALSARVRRRRGPRQA